MIYVSSVSYDGGEIRYSLRDAEGLCTKNLSESELRSRVSSGEKIYGVLEKDIVQLLYIGKGEKARYTEKDFAYAGVLIGSAKIKSVVRVRSAGDLMVYEMSGGVMQRFTVYAGSRSYREYMYAEDDVSVLKLSHGHIKGVVLERVIDKGLVKYRVLIKDKQSTLNLDELTDRKEEFESICITESVEEEGHYTVSCLRGRYEYDMKLYAAWSRRGVSENRAEEAARILGGGGRAEVRGTGELKSSMAGRNGVLSIPKICNALGKGSVDISAVRELRVYGNVKKVEKGAFILSGTPADNGLKLVADDLERGAVVGLLRGLFFVFKRSSHTYKIFLDLRSGTIEFLIGLMLVERERFYRGNTMLIDMGDAVLRIENGFLNAMSAADTEDVLEGVFSGYIDRSVVFSGDSFLVNDLFVRGAYTLKMVLLFFKHTCNLLDAERIKYWARHLYFLSENGLVTDGRSKNRSIGMEYRAFLEPFLTVDDKRAANLDRWINK